MLITNVKLADPLKVYGNGLSFNDSSATSDEIIDFINAVPQEITSLNFTEKSNLPKGLGKIKKLDSLMISHRNRGPIPAALLAIPIARLDLRRCLQDNLSLSLFQNGTVSKMFIYGNFQKLPQGDYNLPKLEMLHVNSEDLIEMPKGDHYLPSLTALYIPRCELKSIPSTFLSGEKLQELNIASSVFNQLPDNLSQCKDLRNLTITAPLLEGIPNLINTSILNVTLVNLKGQNYKICQLPKTVLAATFSGETVVGSFPDLSECDHLLNLTISNGENYPKLSSSLSSLSTLSCMNIGAKELPAEFDNVVDLRTIYLRNCPIKSFPLFLLNCAPLTKLQFDNVQISEIPDNWKSCVNLEMLIIKSDVLRVKSLAFAQIFKKLKTLDLSNTSNFNANVRAVLGGNRPILPKSSLLEDKYSLIGKKRIPLSSNCSLLNGCQFRPVYYNGGGRSKSLKPQTFLDFCAALGKTNLSQEDKEYFFDLFWNSPSIQSLPIFDFPTFLKALTIQFKPLTRILQRRLVREVLLQHFVKIKLVKSPVIFETPASDKFLLHADSQPMLENIRTFLRNDMVANVLLGLQMLKSGGVPADMAEELLLLAKTHFDSQVRQISKDLLKDIVPDSWQELLKNQLVFHYKLEEIKQGFWEKQLHNLANKTKPELAAFFALLVRSTHNENSGTVTDIDEFLYSVAENLGIEEKLLNKDAVVFVNGSTSLKKGEIKDKLEAIGIKYATKYSDKVTHVLFGKNPKVFDIQRADIQILVENYLQKYLSQAAPDFLEQAELEGDTSMSDNVIEFLESEDASSALIGLEMLKTGGVPDSVLPTLLVMQKSYDDAKVRGAAKKLLMRYGSADWLPLMSSRLLFKSIGKGGKETDNFNRLIKLEKETSFELAAELSIRFYERYKRGLRFLIKRGTKGKEFHFRAYQTMYKDGFLDLFNGVGYTNWRTKGDLDGYFGSVGMVNMSITLPKNINDLGKITSIDLHNVKVRALPKGLTNLVDLEKIDASFNGLKSLPQGLKKLKNLEVLDLSFNYFDSFPERVVELPALKKLDLRHQKIEGLEVPNSVREALPDCEIIV